MPRQSQGARLYRERNGVWYIRDGKRFLSTRTRDRKEADRALARYIAEKDRPAGPRDPASITIGEVLEIYGREHAPTVTDPARIGYAILALEPILGAVPVANLTGGVCRHYEKARGKAPGTVRRELACLQAALNYCATEGYLTSAPRVKLPAKPPARDRVLDRDEVAKLLRAAYRNPKAKHLARFILTAIYSGTRSEAVLSLRYMPHHQGGACRHRGRADVPPRGRAGGDQETDPAGPDQPPAAGAPAPLGTAGRTACCRSRRRARRQRQGGRGRTALREAGIEHATRHDLRHTCATWLMQAGVDRWQAAGYLGMSVEVLESTYGHHHPDHLRDAAQAIGKRA